MNRVTRYTAAAAIAAAAIGTAGLGSSASAHATGANGALTPGLAAAHFGRSMGGTADHPLRGGALRTARADSGSGFNEDGGNWSGMVSTGSGFTSTVSSWVEPSVTCNSSDDLMAPWVGIDGYGSSSVEQTGVATDCSTGSPVYQAWYEMYPASPVYYSNTVKSGDHITATVSRSGTSYTLKLADTTQGWTKTTSKSYSGKNASADFVMESPTASYPKFSKVTFSGDKVNGSALSNFSPVALDASNDNGYEDHTSALSSSGTSFSISYLSE